VHAIREHVQRVDLGRDRARVRVRVRVGVIGLLAVG